VISLAVAAADWVGLVHPEITPPSNFHHIRDTTNWKLRQTHLTPKPTLPWSEAQRRAYVITDNKVASNGGWNDEILHVEVISHEVHRPSDVRCIGHRQRVGFVQDDK
jgi:hypothetical protein